MTEKGGGKIAYTQFILLSFRLHLKANFINSWKKKSQLTLSFFAISTLFIIRNSKATSMTVFCVQYTIF
jgi:hypothetical protein